MHPDAEQLIELATRPLADNAELQMVAESELRRSLETHARNRPGAVKVALDSLMRADLHPKRGCWKYGLYVVTFLVSLLFIAQARDQISRMAEFLRMVSSMSSAGGAPASSPQRLQNLTPAQYLLLYGDEAAANEADRWKALWESNPSDPVYLATHANAYFNANGGLSPEILEAAEQIDPDNGWFLALSASGKVEDAVVKEKRTPAEAKEGKAEIITIHDEQKLEEILGLLHRVASKPRASSYQTELLRRQITLFPPRPDWLSQIALITHTAGMTAPGVPLRKLPDAFAGGAARCADKGDVEGYRRLVADWHSVTRSFMTNGESIVELLVAKVAMQSPLRNFRDAATKLGLEEEARYFSDLDDQVRQNKEERKLRKSADDAWEGWLRKKGSMLAGLTTPMVASTVKNPPPYTEEDARPGRLADHALFGRVLTFFGWSVLVILLPSLAFGYRRGTFAGRLSRRMMDLVQPRDWLLLFGGGVIFPVFWYLAITRLSPYGAREWSVGELSFFPAVGEFVPFWLSLILVPWAIASGIVSRRGAIFGAAPKYHWLTWVAATAALAGVPAVGGVRLLGGLGLLIYLSMILPVFAVSVWLISCLVSGRESRSLRRGMLARLLLPAGSAGLFTLAILLPLHHAEERYWIQRDRMNEISTDAPALSRHEYEVTQILRSELLETLGELP